MKKTVISIIGLIFVISFVAIAGKILTRQSLNLETAKGDKLVVAASFYPIYFFASQIGGDKAQVFNITPPSAEPHDFEPTTQVIVKIHESNMLVMNGGNLEPWSQKLQDQLSGSNVKIVIAGAGLTNNEMVENGQKIQDPHIWLDPLLAKKEAGEILAGFKETDPKDAAYFEKNAELLVSRLDSLDKEYRDGLKNCQKKDFVTAHAAFGYIAAQYGLNQVAISGVTPDEEPSSQKMAEIADLVRKENIKIIFFEKLVSPKLSQAIAAETGAKTLVLDPIEGITKNETAAGQNYFSLMENNLNNLKAALDCKS
ncbi:zinc ABC transporter substrate-binding protein [Patescibacteria group bacterium]|nr:zinc ABC transporter substrate-binding protein [Patescibacteria group bacterium]